MADFNDFDVEIQDDKQAEVEVVNSSVTTAGSPDTITPSSGRPLQEALVINPSRGPRANAFTDLLFVTVDSQTAEVTVTRGGNVKISGTFTSVSIDTNNNGTNYEVILRS